MKSLSKIIKSSRVKIGDERLLIPATITINQDAYLDLKHQASRYSGDQASRYSGEQSGAFEEGSESHGWHHSAHSGGSDQMVDIQQEIESMLEQAQKDVNALLADAQVSAHRIESEAIDQAKVLFEKTKQEAYEQGLKDGFMEGQNSAEHLIQEALAIKEDWLEKRLQMVAVLEKESIQLVLASLEKILGETYQTPEYVEQLIRVGMSNMAYTESVVIRVSERDYNYAFALKEKVLAMAENIDTLEIKADYALKPGQVYIETQTGVIDASIQTQLDQIRDLFEALLVSD